jgi:hypothetical protein
MQTPAFVEKGERMFDFREEMNRFLRFWGALWESFIKIS